MIDRSRLEAMLGDLAGSIDWPDPDRHLPARVVARIRSQPARPASRDRRRVAVALAAVALISGLMVLSPSARQAVADLLGTAGIRIGLTSESSPPTGAGLGLGVPVRLAEVSQMVDFEVRAPVGGPGSPDGVYLREGPPVLSMVWAGSRALPAARGTDVSLLLTQRKSQHDRDFAFKALGPGIKVSRLSVEGRPAVWIEGSRHTFTLLDPEGNPFAETTRLAANVLLWEENGVDLRLETTGDLRSALDIVDVLGPLP